MKSKAELKEVLNTEIIEKPKSRSKRAVSVESGVNSDASSAKEVPASSSRTSKRRNTKTEKESETTQTTKKRTKTADSIFRAVEEGNFFNYFVHRFCSDLTDAWILVKILF